MLLIGDRDGARIVINKWSNPNHLVFNMTTLNLMIVIAMDIGYRDNE